MDVNVSQIIAFQRCELDWYYQYVLKRVRRSWNPALRIGDWWHSLMERYFKLLRESHSDPITVAAEFGGAEMRSMALEARAAGFDEASSDFTSECSKLLSQFESRWSLRFFPSSIISIEEPVRRALPNISDEQHFLVGIPDTVVTIHSQRWHLQHKTASDRTPMPIFIQRAERSLHELAYAWLLEDSALPYGGTYLNIIRKLSSKAIKEKPDAAFVQELIPLRNTQISHAISDISSIVHRMSDILSGSSPIDNREADTNPFGNVLSPYFNVKLGIESLDDDSLFTDFISRYEEAPHV